MEWQQECVSKTCRISLVYVEYGTFKEVITYTNFAQHPEGFEKS